MNQRWYGTLSIATALACAGVLPAAAEPTPNQAGPAARTQTGSSAQTGAKQMPPRATQSHSIQLGAIASCRPSAQVSASLNRLVSFADPNGDGSVTRAEATSAANFLVGGFFFRADQNADGTVTPKEGRQAREEFVQEQPALSSLLQSARESGAKRPFATIANMLDVDYGQPVKAEQARAAARSAVDDLFASVDQNKDGKLTEAEARQASIAGVQTIARDVFRSIDTNNNQQLSSAEFLKGLEGPAQLAFDMADKNSDGQLSQAEASGAISQIASQFDTAQGQVKR